MEPKVGDKIRLVHDAWPAPGYDAGYMQNVTIDGRKIGSGDMHLVEKLLTPRWFMGQDLELVEIVNGPGRRLFVTKQTVTIELNLFLLGGEFEVIDDSANK